MRSLEAHSKEIEVHQRMFPWCNRRKSGPASKPPAQLAIDRNNSGLPRRVDQSSQNPGERLHSIDFEMQRTELIEQLQDMRE